LFAVGGGSARFGGPCGAASPFPGGFFMLSDAYFYD